MAAILERAAVFVGNDSGLGHIAAAVGTPTLTVFGPGDPSRYHPWGPYADWIVADGNDLRQLDPLIVAARLPALLSGPNQADAVFVQSPQTRVSGAVQPADWKK